MNRKEFIRKLNQSGCVLHRHGARHDLYLNPANGKKQPVPRHTEIDEKLVKHILKHLGIHEQKID
ncbi:MAG: type II toxin-antitoxin system HicA family toxin [Candidatus Omnitrophica bacterium]|nr:type II toxin-antitoxin system HicA family toxin [Candidatus Omnitrophota bacterium]